MAVQPYHWSDLKKVSIAPGSRQAFAISLLLSGQRIDLAQVPSIPGHRQPGKVRNQLRRMLAKHEGISCEGDVYWIPDLCTGAS